MRIRCNVKELWKAMEFVLSAVSVDAEANSPPNSIALLARETQTLEDGTIIPQSIVVYRNNSGEYAECQVAGASVEEEGLAVIANARLLSLAEGWADLYLDRTIVEFRSKEGMPKKLSLQTADSDKYALFDHPADWKLFPEEAKRLTWAMEDPSRPIRAMDNMMISGEWLGCATGNKFSYIRYEINVPKLVYFRPQALRLFKEGVNISIQPGKVWLSDGASYYYTADVASQDWLPLLKVQQAGIAKSENYFVADSDLLVRKLSIVHAASSDRNVPDGRVFVMLRDGLVTLEGQPITDAVVDELEPKESQGSIQAYSVPRQLIEAIGACNEKTVKVVGVGFDGAISLAVLGSKVTNWVHATHGDYATVNK